MRHGHHPSVYLWGGEPMLYDGVLDIIARAAALHLPVSVATNGHAVAARAAQIVGAPLFLLQVSIDGHCAELHDRLRPARDGRSNFTEVCAALDAVRAARACAGTHLPITAGLVTITNANSGHLVDIYEAFRDRVDLFVFYLAWWIDAAHAAAHEHAFARRFGTIPVCHRGFMAVERPTAPAQLAAQFQALRHQSRARRAPAVMVIPPLTAAGDLERYYSDHGYRFGFARCPAIHQAAEVSSNGDLVTCRDYSDYVVGNVGTATITELWNSKRFMAFRRSIARDGLMPACSRCCGLMGY
jgi:radical SAM protein with 4Fe4S-binding SPASM domain